MEKVLDEIKVLTAHIKSLKQDRSVLEDGISDIQYQRANLEIKSYSLKQKQIQDGVKLESDLKNELEQKKHELEELQEILQNVRSQVVMDQKLAAGNIP